VASAHRRRGLLRRNWARTNCFWFAWCMVWLRGGSCLIRRTRKPLHRFGWHWLWSPTIAPHIGFWRSFGLFRRNGGYWWCSWSGWGVNFYWTFGPPSKLLHYEPQRRMARWQYAMIHKLLYRGAIKRQDKE
jgi:hypothetical protein